MAAQSTVVLEEARASGTQIRGCSQRPCCSRRTQLDAVRGPRPHKLLESENGPDILLKRLDKQWAFDDKVEMPNSFDAFFFKLKRRQHQTLLDYTTEFHQVLRQTKHKLDLPEEVTGWMMLKRAGLTREQEQMVQTQIGSTLTLGAVEQSLFLLFGQDYRQVHIPHHLRRQQQLSRWKRPQSVHMAWDEDATDDLYEIEESYFQDAEDDPDYQNFEEWFEPEIPEGTYYEEAAEDPEHFFDTEEFDEIYSTYVDAKQHFIQGLLKRPNWKESSQGSVDMPTLRKARALRSKLSFSWPILFAGKETADRPRGPDDQHGHVC